MKQFLLEVFQIIRPFGLRRLVFIVCILLAQVVTQLAFVFSLVPFLQAATDINAFRASRLGLEIIDVFGNISDNIVVSMTGAFALAMLVLGNLVSLYADYSRALYAHQIGHGLRMQLVRRLLARPYEFFLNTNSSILLKNLVDDVSVFSQGLLSPLLDVMTRIIMAVLMSTAILYFEPVVFGCVVAFLVLYYFVVVAPLRRRASATSSKIQHAVRSLYFHINELLMGIKPVLAGARHRFFIRRNEEASVSVARIMPLVPLYSAIPKSGLEIAVFGGLIVWVLTAIGMGQDIVSLVPTIGLIAVIAYRLMPSLQLILVNSVSIIAQRQAMDEIVAFMQADLELTPHRLVGAKQEDNLTIPMMEWDQELRFNNVSFAYSGSNRPTIVDVSFVVRKGERVAFVGATGSGKSTLVDLILGLLEPTQGSILVDGQSLAEERLTSWRNTVGYVPQDLFLVDGTIGENIAFGFNGRTIDMNRVRTVSKQCEALEFVEQTTAAGFDTIVGERGVRLSGGQRQRLTLARALYSHPSVLVLDEATSALDPQTEQRVVKQIMGANETITTISITHRLNTLADYDRIYFLRAGEIIESGTFDEIMGRSEDFRNFLKQA